MCTPSPLGQPGSRKVQISRSSQEGRRISHCLTPGAAVAAAAAPPVTWSASDTRWATTVGMCVTATWRRVAYTWSGQYRHHSHTRLVNFTWNCASTQLYWYSLVLLIIHCLMRNSPTNPSAHAAVSPPDTEKPGTCPALQGATMVEEQLGSEQQLTTVTQFIISS